MNITLYCSSRSKINPQYDECARRIGHWIGSNGHTLVYGGVDRGDMRIAAEACHDAGGQVIGVVPSTRRGNAWRGNDENLLPEDLNQRKDILINLGDRFIALPGGYGTLDEILSTLSQMMFTLTDFSRRMLIVNIDGIFDPLLAQFEKLAEIGILDRGIFRRFEVVGSVDEAIDRLPGLCS